VLVDLVLAELVYVLESVYEQSRGRVAEAARSLLALPTMAVVDLALPTMAVVDLDLALRAIELYETEGLHFAEAYLAASAELSGIGRVASFDRRLDRVATIQRIEP
jgi:predicted nucleic acid-binding protein